MDASKIAVVVALALQLVLPSLLTLVYPCEVWHIAGATPAQIGNTLSLSLLGLAAAVILQSFRRGPIGAGLLLPSLSSGVHLTPSLLAVKVGGLPAVAGMTLFAGFSEMLFSFFAFRIRALFSHAVVGLILFLVGLEIGLSGFDTIFTVPSGSGIGGPWTIALSAIAGILLLGGSKLTSPFLKTLAPLVVFVLMAVVGSFLAPLHSASFAWFGLPSAPAMKFAFHPGLVLPFLAAAIASGIRTLGGVRILHEEVHRDSPLRASQGIRADAAGTLLCGFAGSIGVCAAMNSIPTEKAAGVSDPKISLVVALFLILAALCPILLGFIATAPECAKGPLLIFYGVLMALSGWEEIRKDRSQPGFGWQVGIPLGLVLVALAHEASLHFGFRPWPSALESLAGSLMTIGIVSAFAVKIGIHFSPSNKT